MAKGYIYILANEAMPGIVKIGKTAHSGSKRANELSSHSGVPIEFIVISQFLVMDISKAERLIHDSLSEYRINVKREFFEISLSDSISKVLEIIIKNNLLFQVSNKKIISLDDINSVSKLYFDLAFEKEKIESHYEAIKFYEKAIEINPKFNEAKINRIYCYIEGLYLNEIDNLNDFLNQISTLIESNKNNSKLYYCRGIVCECLALEADNEGFFDLFIEYLKRAYLDYSCAISFDNSNYIYYINRAELHTHLHSIDLPKIFESEKYNPLIDFDFAISKNLNNPYLYHKRAKYYIKVRNYRMALDDYNSVIELYPDNRHKYRYYEERGDLYFKMKLHSSAVINYELAMESSLGSEAKYYEKISNVYLDKERFSESERYMLKIIAKSPDSCYYRERLGIIQYKGKKNKEAVDCFIFVIENSVREPKISLRYLRNIYKNNPELFSNELIHKVKKALEKEFK